jgi:hypothetical protein
MKYHTIEVFENIWNILGNNSNNLVEYMEALDSYETLVDDSLPKKYENIDSEFQNIVILYTKYIFKGDIIRLKKPKLVNFIKAFFQKFKSVKFVRNGTFFNSSMVEQDFLFRDLFRQTLFSDCIKITQRKTLENEEYDKESVLPKFSVLTFSEVPAKHYDFKHDDSKHDDSKHDDSKHDDSKTSVSQNVKNESIKSFHSFSLPSLQNNTRKAPSVVAPSEILMNFIEQEEEKEEQEKEEEELEEEELEVQEVKLQQENYEKQEEPHQEILKKEKEDVIHVAKDVVKDVDHAAGHDKKIQLETVKPETEKDFCLSDDEEEEITEDDSISRVMEKMYMQTVENVENPEKKKKIKKIILN